MIDLMVRPSLPGSDARPGRLRCAGSGSDFLAASNDNSVTRDAFVGAHRTGRMPLRWTRLRLQ